MTRFAVPSIIVGVLVALLGVLAIVLGLGLLPSQAEAVEKGTFAPWVIVWMMIVATDICAFALAGFLMRHGVRGLARQG